MKLKTTVGALLEAYAITSPTLDNKGASSNLYLQANDKSGFLYLYSTNLITETATKIKAEIEKPGEALVNPGKLSDGLTGISKESQVTLELTPTGNQLKVQCGKVRFSLSSSTDIKEVGNRMKAIPSQQTASAKVPASELIEFTKRSVFCIPNDQSGQRANLAALRICDTEESGEEAYATDGSIIVHISSAQKQSKGEIGATGILIPAQALMPLSGLVAKKKGQTIDIIITEKRNKIFFKFADGTYFGALTMATAYPNLKPILSRTSDFQFEVAREPFKQALLRSNSFVKSGITKKSLELEFNIDLLSLRANGDDALSDEVPIEYKGTKPTQAVKLGMNIDYLINIVTGSRSENLTFGFSKDNQPLVITDKEGDDEDRINIKYVVMGMRLSN